MKRYDCCYDECNNAWIGEDNDGEYLKVEDLIVKLDSIMILKVPKSIQFAMEALIKDLKGK